MVRPVGSGGVCGWPASLLPKLMCSRSTRYFAVAKVMNQTLVGFAFHPIMVKGFIMFYDKKIVDLRVQLQQVAILRRACLVASAQTIMEITKAQGFKPFLDGVISHKVHEMWVFMEPLFSPDIARNEAWEDFRHIWREAARIGMLMMSKAPTLTFEFPLVGSNSHFNPSNMVSRDVNFKQDPQPVATLKTWKAKTWKRKPKRHNLIGRNLEIGSCDT